MGKKTDNPEKLDRRGWCPVFDLACPSGLEAAEACEHRFDGDYNPLTNYRDADISHCALYRQEQLKNEQNDESSNGGKGVGA